MNLQIVLQTLRNNQLYAKYSKCQFFKDQLQCLGNVITQEGIVLNLEKIKMIME